MRNRDARETHVRWLLFLASCRSFLGRNVTCFRCVTAKVTYSAVRKGVERWRQLGQLALREMHFFIRNQTKSYSCRASVQVACTVTD